jgi:phage terminase large subunit-like protein
VSDVLRFKFCVWTQAASRAIEMSRWMACQTMPRESELLGSDCFGCLDIGETDDFTAWGRLWCLPDGRVAVKFRFFLPEVALQRYPNRPYKEWSRAGLLTVTEGDITDFIHMRSEIAKDCKADGVQSVFYDQRSARETAQLLSAEGIDMVPMQQGFAMDEAIKRMLALIVTGELCHGNNSILTWMASNLVLLTGRTDNRKRVAKERSPEKIDGMAALVMGIDGAVVRRERKPVPQYQVMFFGGAR